MNSLIEFYIQAAKRIIKNQHQHPMKFLSFLFRRVNNGIFRNGDGNSCPLTLCWPKQSMLAKVKRIQFRRQQNAHALWFLYFSMLLLSLFSHVRLCVTPQTAAHQAPPFLGFSRQEHWSGVPLPSLILPHSDQ